VPQWGAVKGFAGIRNNKALPQEELGLVVDWIQGDMLKCNNPNDLPKEPKFKTPVGFKRPLDSPEVSGNVTLGHPLTLDGLWPEKIPAERTSESLPS